MGDPASIGPEITIKVFLHNSLYRKCNPIVIRDASVLDNAIGILGVTNVTIHSISSIPEASFQPNILNVLDMKLIDMAHLKRGKVLTLTGEAAFQYVNKVIELALNKEIDATVTNAFNKEAINLAGHHYSGHTEIYADLTHTQNYTMMLAHKNLRVVHISTHVSLIEACKNLGIENPKIGVAKNTLPTIMNLIWLEELNNIIIPHAGFKV